ncbi:MAG: preprotein translocase subunit SecG [Lachnospiraceae bacterium]|nr:preprotein translocase subunit SecG [Lachnospiraceae bacterium]
MKSLYIGLVVIYCLICIALVVVVLMQEGKSGGLSAFTGSSSTYWSKNKGRSVEGKLALITRVLATLFIVLSIVLALTIWTHN